MQLFLVADVDSLCTANPATHPEAVFVPAVMQLGDVDKLQASIPRPCESMLACLHAVTTVL